ncbi:hypothetical protein GCM10011529_16870 [Polymorphobacter glacialis]|uniref:Curlin n=1 Tax=Sandarakinorhabdus glacialis TaxID=1614636 RepID=A0A916ZS04_9SPHN|nr:hypothetical protein [Polymorphobacter glacialis]GGE11113.1 hypothetical protein GCM10011529_16870 [Polymorphobacter glacialis]
MNNSNLLLLVLASALPAPVMAGTDPQFGITVSNNIAIQAVDMNPQYAGVSMAGGNGQRSVDAHRRYLSGNVKTLMKVDGKAEVGGQGGGQEVQTLQPQGK